MKHKLGYPGLSHWGKPSGTSFRKPRTVNVCRIASFGVASYALDALLSSDYAPVQGFVLLMAFVFVIVNLVVDVLYGIADPRISIG